MQQQQTHIYPQFRALCLQGQTMQMMYAVVARELKAMQITDLHPQDYLNFYCLGNREEMHEQTVASNGATVIV